MPIILLFEIWEAGRAGPQLGRSTLGGETEQHAILRGGTLGRDFEQSEERSDEHWYLALLWARLNCGFSCTSHRCSRNLSDADQIPGAGEGCCGAAPMWPPWAGSVGTSLMSWESVPVWWSSLSRQLGRLKDPFPKCFSSTGHVKCSLSFPKGLKPFFSFFLFFHPDILSELLLHSDRQPSYEVPEINKIPWTDYGIWTSAPRWFVPAVCKAQKSVAGKGQTHSSHTRCLCLCAAEPVSTPNLSILKKERKL